MEYNKNKDYCTLSPDRILGCTFNYGCFLHDRQYRNEVAKRKTRKQADIQLRNVIYKILRTSRSPFEIRLRIKALDIDFLFFKTSNAFFINLRKKIASPWSMVYYFAVRLLGGLAWEKE